MIKQETNRCVAGIYPPPKSPWVIPSAPVFSDTGSLVFGLYNSVFCCIYLGFYVFSLMTQN